MLAKEFSKNKDQHRDVIEKCKAEATLRGVDPKIVNSIRVAPKNHPNKFQICSLCGTQIIKGKIMPHYMAKHGAVDFSNLSDAKKIEFVRGYMMNWKTQD